MTKLPMDSIIANDAASGPASPDRTAAETVKRLQGLLGEALADHLLVLRQHGCALLDFPDHGNVGDSAIWAGQIAFLDCHGIARQLAGANDMDLSEVEVLPPDVPVLLHGGGNFGDLWPHHQMFREAVLSRFRDRLVIQLPQSIHYDDPALIEQTAQVIATHPHFVLMVRDRPSLELARSRFDCDVRLCPDMAFALGPQPRPVRPDRDVVMLMRTDGERRGDIDSGEGGVPQGWLLADWLEDRGETHRGQLMRWQVRAARMSLDECRQQRTEERIRELAAHCDGWRGPLREARMESQFSRGLLAVTSPLAAGRQKAGREAAAARVIRSSITPSSTIVMPAASPLPHASLRAKPYTTS